VVLATSTDAAFAGSPEFAAIVEDVAINVCAYSPEFISPEDVQQTYSIKRRRYITSRRLPRGSRLPSQTRLSWAGEQVLQRELPSQAAVYKDESGKETVEGFVKKAPRARYLDTKVRSLSARA